MHRRESSTKRKQFTLLDSEVERFQKITNPPPAPPPPLQKFSSYPSEQPSAALQKYLRSKHKYYSRKTTSTYFYVALLTLTFTIVLILYLANKPADFSDFEYDFQHTLDDIVIPQNSEMDPLKSLLKKNKDKVFLPRRRHKSDVSSNQMLDSLVNDDNSDDDDEIENNKPNYKNTNTEGKGVETDASRSDTFDDPLQLDEDTDTDVTPSFAEIDKDQLSFDDSENIGKIKSEKVIFDSIEIQNDPENQENNYNSIDSDSNDNQSSPKFETEDIAEEEAIKIQIPETLVELQVETENVLLSEKYKPEEQEEESKIQSTVKKTVEKTLPQENTSHPSPPRSKFWKKANGAIIPTCSTPIAENRKKMCDVNKLGKWATSTANDLDVCQKVYLSDRIRSLDVKMVTQLPVLSTVNQLQEYNKENSPSSTIKMVKKTFDAPNQARQYRDSAPFTLVGLKTCKALENSAIKSYTKYGKSCTENTANTIVTSMKLSKTKNENLYQIFTNASTVQSHAPILASIKNGFVTRKGLVYTSTFRYYPKTSFCGTVSHLTTSDSVLIPAVSSISLSTYYPEIFSIAQPLGDSLYNARVEILSRLATYYDELVSNPNIVIHHNIDTATLTKVTSLLGLKNKLFHGDVKASVIHVPEPSRYCGMPGVVQLNQLNELLSDKLPTKRVRDVIVILNDDGVLFADLELLVKQLQSMYKVEVVIYDHRENDIIEGFRLFNEAVAVVGYHNSLALTNLIAASRRLKLVVGYNFGHPSDDDDDDDDDGDNEGYEKDDTNLRFLNLSKDLDVEFLYSVMEDANPEKRVKRIDVDLIMSLIRFKI